jgi:hypothetical protein
MPPCRDSDLPSRRLRSRNDRSADRERLLIRIARFLVDAEYTHIQVVHAQHVEGELHDLFDQPALLVEQSCQHLGVGALVFALAEREGQRGRVSAWRCSFRHSDAHFPERRGQ